MATVIAFVSQKGGVGKSTLARARAREVAGGGLSDEIADLDTQQRTSVDWHRAQLAAAIEPAVAAEAYRTANQALAVAAYFDLLVIGGPTRTSAGTLEIARVANLVVHPAGASVDDLKPGVREFRAITREGIALDAKRAPPDDS